MVDGINHVTLPVSDVRRAVEFYTDVLDLADLDADSEQELDETTEYYWLGAGEDRLYLAVHPQGTPSRGNGGDSLPRITFAAPAVERTEIKRRLADREHDVRETQNSIYFHDPDGNYVEVTDESESVRSIR